MDDDLHIERPSSYSSRAMMKSALFRKLARQWDITDIQINQYGGSRIEAVPKSCVHEVGI